MDGSRVAIRKRWHVVMTKARAEWPAHRLLLQQRLDSRLLFEEKVITRRGVPMEIRSLLYPRYLFVGCDHDGAVHAINRTPGVSTVVWGVDGPYEIPEPVIASELARGELVEEDDLAGGIRIKPPEVDESGERRMRLKRGARVRITEGPFESFHGNVVLDKGRRIVVEAELFGRLSPVELPPSAVEIVSPEWRSYHR